MGFLDRKKIVITGHTSGIGKALYQSLQGEEREVVGISRSNGYDISKDREKILLLVKDAHVFVNNAFSEFDNVHLLYEIFNLWKEENKLIVNIGSESSDGIKDFVHPYAVMKAALDKATEQLQNISGSQCRVLNIRSGFVDTPSVKDYDFPKLHVNDLVQNILWCMDQSENVYIKSISLRVNEMVR